MHRELHRRRAGLDSPFWVSHFSGKLTDVAAFHPRTQRSSASSSDRSASSGSGVRRSAGSWRERRGAREVAGGGAAPLGRSPSQSQTLQLDVNIDYLLNSYLGRHLPQGGKAAAVRAAAAHTGRAESGQTPR